MPSLLPTVIILALCTLAARAHPNLQNAMFVRFETSQARVFVNVSVKELSVVQGIQGLPNGGVGRLDTAAIHRAAESHANYLLKHLTLTNQGAPLSGRVAKVTPPPFFTEPDQTFYQYEIEYAVIGPLPEKIGFSHDMLKEWSYAAGIPWNVSYVVRPVTEGGVGSSSWLLPRGEQVAIPTGWLRQRTAVPPADEAPARSPFRDYLRHGILHILTGYDHLLFVAALVLAARGFLEMIKVIAAFTLAHTVTLALCVFGILRIPSTIVEPVIALSIVFVSLENLLWPHRAHSRGRLLVAFGFGLVHGLGFAGGLLDAMTGLPVVGIWIALIAFSVGVEIGHQLVVLPLFGLLARVRSGMKQQTHSMVLRSGSAAISCGGGYYLAAAVLQGWFK